MFSIATMQKTLDFTKDRGQPLPHFVAKGDLYDAKLASRDASMDKGLLLLLPTESCGDCFILPYGMAL